MKKLKIISVVVMAICLNAQATSMIPAMSEEQALASTDLLAKVRVTAIKPYIENGATKKWAKIISIEILTSGVSAKKTGTVFWNQALADVTMTKTKPVPPHVGQTYRAHLKKSHLQADFECVHADWGFVKIEKGKEKTEPSVIEHMVKKGDTLWGLARRYYGKGQRWRILQIANFEKEVKEAEGEVYPLKPGMKIRIPTFAMEKKNKKENTQPEATVDAKTPRATEP